MEGAVDTLASSPSTTDPARPVDTTERVVLLDVLRGFALGGVFLSNVFEWFSGRVFLPSERMSEFMAQPVGIAIYIVFATFVSGKFVTIFSFLFGLGFYVQLSRAEARGTSIVSLYLRRLAILFGIGALHTTLLWHGDILHTYAFVGLGLLLFRKQSDRKLIIWGLVLGVFFFPLLRIGSLYVPRLWFTPEAIEAGRKAEIAHFVAADAAALVGFSSSSYVRIVKANVAFFWALSLSHLNNIGIWGDLLGKFLLGYVAGKRGVFADVEAHRKFFWRLFGWGLSLALVFRVLTFLLQWLVKSGKLAPTSWIPRLFTMPLNNLSMLAMAAFYVATIVLLFQREWPRKILSAFAPAGRMALSNYLLQSVVGVFVFCGIGLGKIGTLDLRWTVLLPMVVFSVQMVASHFWLKRFRFGPAEWVWRSLTYGQPQKMLAPRGS